MTETRSRVLAIDLGTVRVGLALSDPLRITGQPMGWIPRKSLREDLRPLTEIIDAHDVETVVVGHPLLMSGIAGEGAVDAQAFVERLRGELTCSVVLWDAHSIASRLPRFFDGKLPDVNLGTADGRSCAPHLQAAVEAVLQRQSAFTHVSNGRFKGGHITRHYGAPKNGVHALQLEMCQSIYMDETAPFAYRLDLAAQVQPLLRSMLEAVMKARAG